MWDPGGLNTVTTNPSFVLGWFKVVYGGRLKLYTFFLAGDLSRWGTLPISVIFRSLIGNWLSVG